MVRYAHQVEVVGYSCEMHVNMCRKCRENSLTGGITKGGTRPVSTAACNCGRHALDILWRNCASILARYDAYARRPARRFLSSSVEECSLNISMPHRILSPSDHPSAEEASPVQRSRSTTVNEMARMASSQTRRRASSPQCDRARAFDHSVASASSCQSHKIRQTASTLTRGITASIREVLAKPNPRDLSAAGPWLHSSNKRLHRVFQKDLR